MFKKIAIYLAIMALPAVTFADNLTKTRTLLESVGDIVRDVLIPLVFTLALLYFFYGVGKYIWSEGQGKADGRSIMIWGVVALTVMTTIWGLVSFIGTEFGLENQGDISVPNIGGPTKP